MACTPSLSDPSTWPSSFCIWGVMEMFPEFSWARNIEPSLQLVLHNVLALVKGPAADSLKNGSEEQWERISLQWAQFQANCGLDSQDLEEIRWEDWWSKLDVTSRLIFLRVKVQNGLQGLSYLTLCPHSNLNSYCSHFPHSFWFLNMPDPLLFEGLCTCHFFYLVCFCTTWLIPPAPFGHYSNVTLATSSLDINIAPSLSYLPSLLCSL